MDVFNNTGKFTETLKLSDIKKGEYKLIGLRNIDTKFGPSIIANIIIDNDEFQIFLPKKYSSKLTEKDILEINNEEDCYLKYNGKKIY